MAIVDALRRILGSKMGGGYLTEMAIPPGWNYEKYLQAYGEAGWLFGAVSLISNSMAQVEWQAFNRKARKEFEELADHVILDLLDKVNPFQTRYQFFLLMQTYIGLVGEAFIILEYNRLRVPAQMWLAPPCYMYVIQGQNKYISHYEYRKGNITVRLEIPEVIHIMDPNPANPYRGIAPAKAVSLDIDSEIYASRHQQRLFFNDATPGLFLEFPELPSEGDRKRIREEFTVTHQGWRNAHKPAFLFGGAKANTIALSPKDMEFKELRNASKKLILGAYHIPESLIGAADIGSRARAEADEYIFAKYTIQPALIRIREALNEQLCPLYDEKLYLDFVNPVPADETVNKTNTREDFKAGIITREEARVANGFDAEAESGQTYLVPFSLVPSLSGESSESIAPKALIKQSSKWSDEQKEAYWWGYVAKTEAEERPFLKTLQSLWSGQEGDVIGNLGHTASPDGALFAEEQAVEDFTLAFKPLIANIYQEALTETIESHKGIKQGLINELAWQWIASRSLELAKMVNGTTKEQLRAILAEGFNLGESIPQLTKRIREFYGNTYKRRALMVARTEVITASAKGTEQGFKELGIKKVEWYTAMDERTCEECLPLHGKIYGINEGPRPALHPQCRCVILSVED